MSSTMDKLPPGVTRTCIPFIVDDMLIVSDPDLIRKISASPDLGRPGEQQVSFTLRLFFEATKFNNAGSDGGPVQWAAPMVGTDSHNYPARIADTRARLQRGFTQAEVARFDALVRNAASGMGLRDVGAHCAKLVAPLLLPLDAAAAADAPEKLPDDVAYASIDTLLELPSMFNPFAYLAARRSRRLAEDYVRKLMPDAEYPIDYVHNLGAAAQGLGKAIVRLAKVQGGSFSGFAELVNDPVIPTVGRVPMRETTLDGLLPEDKPLVPGKSMVTLKIGEAFTSTKEPSFMFGTGTDDRQCPFKNLFLSTLQDLEYRR